MRQRCRCFVLANWERYQHYQNRWPPPPWIKLHSRLLEDHEFCSMPEEVQLLAIKLMLMASKCGNHVPADVEWLARQFGIDAKEATGRLESLLSEQYVAPCECEKCQILPPIVWLHLESRPSLEPTRARAGVSLSSTSSSVFYGDRGPGEGVELEPLPPALGCITLPQQALSDHQLEGLATVADAWVARLTAPNILTPGRADQLGQIAALDRAVATYSAEPAAALVVTALVKRWRGFDDAMVEDRLGKSRNGHHPKPTKRQAEARAGVDPEKLKRHGAST